MAALCGAALVASAVDAIGGGGGIVTIPALLAAGLPPHVALGTNKGQSVFGSMAALARYAHAGLVDRAAARYAFPLAIVGSAAGAALTLLIPAVTLRPILLVLVLAAGLVVLLVRPREPAGGGAGRTAGRAAWIMAGTALAIGAYDGFFGPGTGTFLIIIYATLLRLPMARATADAKVVNFGSNVAAVAIFAHGGFILWSVALPMAAAQLVGGFLGAHVAVRRGARLIRGVVLVVVLALVVKVARDLMQSGVHL